MAKDEDWKGEHLISAKGANNRKEAMRMANVIYHAKRKKLGIPPAGGAKHDTFMRALYASKRNAD